MGRGATQVGGCLAIIDCDPGVDDFLAIRLALMSPELDVRALTVTGGNCPLRLGIRNALRAVEDMGRFDLPVHAGASRPYSGRFTGAAPWHGKSGLTGRLPRPVGKASAVPAVDALARILLNSPAGTVTVIALGPLTNVARLIESQPSTAARFDSLVVMGGAVDVPGNVTSFAEFNIWADAEAAQIVMRSGLPVKLVGIDVCRELRLRESDAIGMHGAVGRVLRGWFRMRSSGDEMVLYDPVAVAAAIEPRSFEWERTGIDVATQGEQRGRTVRSAGSPPIQIATSIDTLRVGRLFQGRVF